MLNIQELTKRDVFKMTPVANGIDVSKWQGGIDWQAVKADGVEFAMIRMGLGNKNGSGYRVDPYFVANVEGAVAAGVDVGCYFYSYATSADEARNEAAFVVDVLKEYKGVFTYPIALDLEHEGLQVLGKEVLTSIVLAFGEVISDAGYYYSLYSNPNWLTYYLDDSQLTHIDHWLAQWSGAPLYPGQFGMWQNSYAGHIAGISTLVDTDIAYVDYPALVKGLGLNGLEAEPEPEPKPIEEFPPDMISGSALKERIEQELCYKCHRLSKLFKKKQCGGCAVRKCLSVIDEFVAQERG